ncbi:MAG: hypothetical protein PHF63_14340 [Herbinix sp.]|nr:hypothetical protein [Herbinix sp.]
MEKKRNNKKEFSQLIIKAVEGLRKREFEKSYQVIIESLEENPNAPEPQNLLGIWQELQGNDDMARKHYRAAYALDPTYKPASENLERLCEPLIENRERIDFDKIN